MSVKSCAGAACVAIVLSLGHAQAADLPTIQPYSATVSGYDWSGFYIGAQAGYAWSNVDRVNTVGFANSFDAKGVVGGIHAGYNHQIGNWVLGVEGDIELSGIDGNDAGVGGGFDTLEAKWQGSVRGRLGYAFDRTLVYATGGVAFGGFEATTNIGGAVASDKNTHVGWTIGAGVEHAITKNVTARIEYRYTDFGSKTYILAPVAANAKYDSDAHTIRVGISYKF